MVDSLFLGSATRTGRLSGRVSTLDNLVIDR
jgi:hypothetical protein